ncbi:MAG: hypothetical protein ABL962_16020, partial [Fimbriimonadaceae bacterium]
MAFFGLVKSKEEREAEALQEKQRAERAARAAMFPNGEADAVRDCKRVNDLIHGKIPSDRLLDFVADCKLSIFGSESQLFKKLSEKQQIDSFVRYRSKGLINERDPQDVYAYLEGEAHFYDDNARLTLKGTGALQT